MMHENIVRLNVPIDFEKRRKEMKTNNGPRRRGTIYNFKSL